MRESIWILIATCALVACTPDLDRAAKTGDVDAVTRALEAGADLHAADAHGITPLMAAVRAGRANVAALLIERGAQVRARDRRGFTALHYASQNGMNDTVRLLVDRGAVLNAAAGTGGYTPLHLAIIASRDETVLLLVERGASITQRTAQGFSALDIATSRNEHKLAAAIEEAEAARAGR
jgi:uncharacterized protein